MAKVNNLFFSDEFRDYLTCNGFEEAETLTSQNRTYFFKGDTAIEVHDNKISISKHFNGEPDPDNGGYALQAAFEGLQNLDAFSFILLMHITGAVTLKQFKKAVDAERGRDQKLAYRLNAILSSPLAVAH